MEGTLLLMLSRKRQRDSWFYSGCIQVGAIRLIRWLVLVGFENCGNRLRLRTVCRYEFRGESYQIC